MDSSKTCLLLVLVAACDMNPTYDADGDGDPTNDGCLTVDCDTPTPGFSFAFENSSLEPYVTRLAVGGEARLVVTNFDSSATSPRVGVASKDDAGLALTHLGGDGKSTTVIVQPTHSGVAWVAATNNLSTRERSAEAHDVNDVMLVIPATYYKEPSTRVLSGENRIAAALCSMPGCYATGSHFLVDSSLQISGLAKTAWDTFAVPFEAGSHAVVLDADSVGAVPFDLEVVDRVDGIGVDVRSAQVGGGSLCFHHTRGGDRVMSRTWQVTTSNTAVTVKAVPRYDNCIDYSAPSGTTASFEIRGTSGLTTTYELVVQ